MSDALKGLAPKPKPTPKPHENPKISFDAMTQKAKDKDAKALAGLVAMGAKKPNPTATINQSEDNSPLTKATFSWGLMDEFLSSYDKGNTDTNSLRWGFLSLIGTLKGRDCWVNFGGRPLYPNMYTALVGDPGCGKSTTITIIKDLLDELGYPSRTPEIVDPTKLAHYFSHEYKGARADALPVGDGGSVVQSSARTNFLESFKQDASDKDYALAAFQANDRHSGYGITTRENLEKLDHDALAIVSSELMGTIPPNAKWFVNKILIDLYDAQDYERYEITEGTILTKPIISLLGGITPAGLASSFSTSDFNTGLLTRIMLVHSKSVEKGNPFEQTHDYKASSTLLESLKNLYKFKGEITISPRAKETYNLITTALYNTVYDIRLTFYYNRRSLFLTKIAMIICLLHGRAEISRSDMITSNTLLLYTEFDMPKTLTDFGNTATIKIRNAIIDYLEKNLHKSKPLSSQDIIDNVSAKLGLSRDNNVVVALQKLVSTDLVTAILVGESNQYFLNKPKNSDIMEAIKIKVADIGAVPEWNIDGYAMEEEKDVTQGLEL